MRSRVHTFLILACLLSGTGYAPRSYGESFRPTKIEIAPRIDGRLVEAEWQEALRVSDFVQRIPRDGAVPSESTYVYLMYTDETLFVGVRAFDTEPHRIVATVMQRDDFTITSNDQFVVAIDSYNDKRNGFWFSTNPLGARVDAQFSNEGDIWESNWDGEWWCEATTDDAGWTAEIGIPFSTLRFQPANENVMGINIFRRIIHTNEQIFAPRIPLEYPYGTPNVSVAREYALEGITAGRRLEIQPYGLLGLDGGVVQPEQGGNVHGDVGLDARYGITSNLRLTLSLNTDFAETEADERQINLTRFPLFFPERRDFFLESAGVFKFGLPEELEVFFSRRVGLVRDSIGAFVEAPILAGGKLTGRLGRGEIGVMSVQTDDTDITGRENFSVARVKYGVGVRSYAGGIVTQRTTGTGTALRSGGLDASLYFPWNTVVSGFAATTDSRDGGNLGDAGAAYLAVARPGERTSFHLGVMEVGPQFEPAMGFLLRRDVRKWTANLRLPLYLEEKSVRRIIPNYDFTRYERRNGEALDWNHKLGMEVEMQSEDVGRVAFHRVQESVPLDFLIFRNVAVPSGRYVDNQIRVGVTTKSGRRVSAVSDVTIGEFFGGEIFEALTSLDWKINHQLTTSLFYQFNHIDLPASAFDVHLARFRASWSFNTKATLAGLVQYENERETLATNVRFRYQVSEGRDLFLVFNDLREDDDKGWFRNQVESTASVKVTYLFTY